jgi:hypothetical protein
MKSVTAPMANVYTTFAAMPQEPCDISASVAQISENAGSPNPGNYGMPALKAYCS